MTFTRRDVLASVFTGLIVFVFAATHEAWNVWLIGTSHRWAAVAVVLLGAVACGFGDADVELSRGREMTIGTILLAVAGGLAAVLAVVAVWTGSLTALSLLVLTIVVLWAAATLRHLLHGHTPHKPVAI
jgi:hypothetical protein